MPGGGRTLKEGDAEQLSLRQLGVTALVAGVSVLPAGAGLGWRGAVLTFPLLLAVGCALWPLLPRWKQMAATPWGRALGILYALSGSLLLGVELRRCALRIIHTGGADPAHTPWLIGLLALPLLWMAWGKGTALFRAAELYYLIAGISLAALLGLALLQGDGSRMAAPDGAGLASGLSLLGAAGSFLFVLPYLGQVQIKGSKGGNLLGWLAALGAIGILLPLAVAGILGPPLASQTPFPVLLMSGALGGSARLEGLVCMLWLFADYARLGLLARSWGGGQAGRTPLAPVGAAVGVGLALWPAVEGLTPFEIGLGTVGLAVLTGLSLLGCRNMVEEETR